MIEGDFSNEGQRSLDEIKNPECKQVPEHQGIDARKMIIYSELLKPKFDEGLN